jgi:hypothetical protein
MLLITQRNTNPPLPTTAKKPDLKTGFFTWCGCCLPVAAIKQWLLLPPIDRLLRFGFQASSLSTEASLCAKSLLPSEKGNHEDSSDLFGTTFASIFEAPSPVGEGRARRFGLAQTVSVRGEAFLRVLLSFAFDCCCTKSLIGLHPRTKIGKTVFHPLKSDWSYW